MKSIGEVLHEMKWDEQLLALALQVEHNSPSHRDPHKYHSEKSEVVNAMRRMAREMKEAAR